MPPVPPVPPPPHCAAHLSLTHPSNPCASAFVSHPAGGVALVTHDTQVVSAAHAFASSQQLSSKQVWQSVSADVNPQPEMPHSVAQLVVKH